MPSTVIKSFSYAPDRCELIVEFVSGRRYLYSGVPAETAQAMRGAFAKGIYFNRHVRDRFPCREVA